MTAACPTVVLTGATGFLGRAVVAELLDPDAGRGPRLLALCRRPDAELERAGVGVAVGSLLDSAWLLRQLPPDAIVVHMAGKVEFAGSATAELHELHVEATRRVARAALARGARFVLVSSSGTTAVSRHERLMDETSPYPLELVSRWPYYLTKTLSERLVLDLCRNEGLAAVILNPSLLLGPGDDRGGSTAVVSDYLAGRIRVVPGGGISVVDVRDAARAVRVAIAEGMPGERYFLASHNCRFATFFAILEQISGKRCSRLSLAPGLALAGSRALHRAWPDRAIHPAMIEMAQHFWYADSSKAAARLGFTARPLEATLRDTIAYLSRHEEPSR